MHVVQAATDLLGRQPGLCPLPLLLQEHLVQSCPAPAPNPHLGKVKRRAHLVGFISAFQRPGVTEGERKGSGFGLESLVVKSLICRELIKLCSGKGNVSFRLLK